MSIKYTALFLWLVSGLNATAQWSTNWPAISNSWWKYSGLIEEVADAVDERRQAPGVGTYPLASANIYWVRRGHLSSIGQTIRSLCTYYIDVAGTRGTNSDYDTWFATGTNSIAMYSPETLIALVTATTSTLWAAETSTNAWEIWTMNYGETLDEFRAAINLLTEWADYGVSPSGRTRFQTSSTNWFSGIHYRAASGVTGGLDPVWVTATAEADTNASTNNFTAFNTWLPAMYTRGELNFALTDYAAERFSYANRLYATGPSGWNIFSSTIYLYAWSMAASGGTYTNNGTALREHLFTLTDTNGPSAASTRLLYVADTNHIFTTAPAWSTSAPVTNAWEYLGWELDHTYTNLIIVVDLAVTNGFAFIP